MTQQREHHDQDEVRRALGRLRPAEAVRLMHLARNWIRRAPRRDAEDLLNEAFDRMLQGRRQWPLDVSLSYFLNGVMRSIASEWSCEDARSPLAEDARELVGKEAGDADKEGDRDFADMLDRMVEALADDPPAQGVLLHMRVGTKRSEAALALRVTEGEYDTARRRMSRKLFRSFGPEWTNNDPIH